MPRLLWTEDDDRRLDELAEKHDPRPRLVMDDLFTSRIPAEAWTFLIEDARWRVRGSIRQGMVAATVADRFYEWGIRSSAQEAPEVSLQHPDDVREEVTGSLDQDLFPIRSMEYQQRRFIILGSLDGRVRGHLREHRRPLADGRQRPSR